MITRQGYIDHILMMHTRDPEYAIFAAKVLKDSMPWARIPSGVSDALKADALQKLIEIERVKK